MPPEASRSLIPPQSNLFDLELCPASPRLSLLEAAGRSYTHGGKRWLRNSIKFFLRSLRHPQLTRHWLDLLSSARVEPLWHRRPRLAQKLQRPYLSCAFPPEQKLEYLKFHYSSLPTLLCSESLSAVYSEFLPLLTLRNESTGRELALQLSYRDQFEMEGDLTLAIADLSTGLCLATTSFSLCRHLGRRTLFIGGLQATCDARIRDNIHDVSKELHGLRPKALGLWCLQQLCAVWGIESLVAVSDDCHVYRHSRKRALIQSSYDEFWAESDGVLQPDGLWALPLVPVRRPRSELKASRRKQYERRYVLLDSLAESFSGAIELLRPASVEQRRHQLRPPVFLFQSREAEVAAPGNVAATSVPLARPTDHSF